jgi:hypothetical protein
VTELVTGRWFDRGEAGKAAAFHARVFPDGHVGLNGGPRFTRAFEALSAMRKIDVAAIERAIGEAA